MDNNKKPSEPAEEERWGIIHYMRSHRPSRMLSSSHASAFAFASRWPVRPGVLL